MRLTKDEFVEAINTLEEMIEQERELSEMINCYEWVGVRWIDNYYKLIENLCDFSEEEITSISGTDLDYFCWELDFGKKWTEDSIEDEDGNSIKLKTPEDLWDYITGKGTS